MKASTSERVQKHRASLRASGLRPVQLWVPDTRAPGFAEQCRRQSLLAAESDARDKDLAGFMESVLADVDGWEE